MSSFNSFIMVIKNMSLLIALSILWTINLVGQKELFSICASIFLYEKLVVVDYSPTGKCQLPYSSTGKLTVCSATYENDKWSCTEKIDFRVAIKDGNTKTLWSFSDQSFKEIDFKQVLAKCKKGDFVVILTVNNLHALPHNEILVE